MDGCVRWKALRTAEVLKEENDTLNSTSWYLANERIAVVVVDGRSVVGLRRGNRLDCASGGCGDCRGTKGVSMRFRQRWVVVEMECF